MSIAQRRDFVQRIPWQIFASRWYIFLRAEMPANRTQNACAPNL